PGTITQWPQQFVAVPASIAPTFLQLDLGYLWTHFGAAFPIVLVIFFGDLMSGLATVMGVCDRGGLVDEHGRIPRLRDALVVDALAASAGACLGTSTIAIYVESGAGVAVGGRTGLTSLVVAACFLLSLFFNPLIAAIPAVATAPALLLVGVLMMQSIVKLNLDDLTVAVPAIVTILLMAIASISDGMAIGILLHLLLMIGSGRARQVPVATYVIGLLFLAHFVL
ncbi:MAG TPA: NCS2 family permease, partial [Chthoniobacterales bacterium]